MRRFVKVTGKILVGLLIACVLLVLLAEGAVNLALRGPQATRLAQKYVGEYLDGDLTLGDGSFRFLTTFPNAKLVLNDVYLKDGADTTAGFSRLVAKVDLPALLKKHYKVPLARVEGLQAHRWDFWHFPSAEADTTGPSLPAFFAHLEVPAARLSYAPLQVRDARVSLFGDAVSAEALDASVDTLRVSVDGLALDARGALQDILGADPAFDVDASLAARLQRLMHYLPASLQGISAEGDVDLALGGQGRVSQLSTKRLNETDLHARLEGDRVRVRFQGDSLFANADTPVITLATHAGGPVTAAVQAGRLELQDSRALFVRLVDTDTQGTLTQILEAGDTLPKLQVTSTGDRLLLRAGTERLALNDFTLKARAQLGDGRVRLHRSPVERPLTVAADSSAEDELPEWLQDKQFQASDIEFRLDESVAALLRRWNPEAELDVPQAVFISPILPLRNSMTDFRASVTNDELQIASARLRSGTSDVSLSGRISGLRQMLLEGEKGPVTLQADMTSKMLNANELLAALAESASLREQVSSEAATMDDEAYLEAVVQDDLADVEMKAETHSLIVVPANLLADVRLQIQNLDYSDLDFYGVQATAAMRERCLQVTNAAASTYFGDMSLDAFYSTKTRQNISAGFNLGLSDITAERVIELIPSVDSLMPVLKNFQGSLDCVLAATAQLDTAMNIQLPTMDGMFRISGEDLRFSGLDRLNRFVKWLLFQRREVGRIDDMMVSGVISKNELEVFPFAVTMDRYSLALSGIQQFDGQFDYKVSVVHSPLPFRFGLRLFGPDYDRIRFRLGKSQFSDTKKIPLFHTEVNEMQVNLVDAIRNVFNRGVERVLEGQKTHHEIFDASRGDLSFLEFDDEIDPDLQAEMEQISVEMDIEAEAEAVNAEIDRMFEELWQI